MLQTTRTFVGHQFCTCIIRVQNWWPTKVYMMYLASLGPVVNILAIFSNANIIKNKIKKKKIPHQRYRLSIIDFD